MKISRVSKMSSEARFLYWIRERHAIYLRRKEGKPKPWTDDEILQLYFFTNPYRENDKTTVWFRKNVRGPMRGSQDVIFATVCFRWFNYIPTGEILLKQGLLTKWNPEKARQYLLGKGKVFTGAFMVNSPPREKKLDAIIRRVTNVWNDRGYLYGVAHNWKYLEHAHGDLIRYEGLGGFMAYEVVCDLRYTRWLSKAKDKLTWCNPGPGCIRGLYRLQGIEIENKSNATSPKKPKYWLETMQKLRCTCERRLSGMPPFEMREVEHSLCEFDKYERARLRDGKLKRKYGGVG